MLKDDPSRIEGKKALGELQSRQGLVAEARQTLSEAYDELAKRNNMREAAEVLRKLVEVDPTDNKVRSLLADHYAREGRQDKAAEEYVAIADELIKKGKPAEALAMIDKSLRSGPRSPRLLAAAAHVHIVQKEYPRAIELLEEARRAMPTDREVSLRLAESYLGAKRAAEARKVLEALLQRDSADQDARQQLGQVYLAEGRYDEAFDSLQPVVDKLVEKRQVERGAALLQQIVQRNPQHTKSLAKLVELYRQTKNDMLVAQTYGQMVEAYSASGGYDQAASILEMLVQLEPHNEQHKSKLRWLKEQRGGAGAPASGAFDVDLSQPSPQTPPIAGGPPPAAPRVAAVELSGPLTPDDQEFISEHLAEGRVFRKYGLGDKAKDQFEAVLGRFPDNIEALTELADIYKEKGDNPAAAQKLRVAAEVHRLKGEADKAALAGAEAEKLAPSAPAAAAPAPAAPPVAAAPPAAAAAVTQPPLAAAAPVAEIEMDIAVEEPAAAPQEDELEYVEMTEAPLVEPQPEFDASDLAPAGGEIGSQFLEEEPAPLVEAAFNLDEEPKPPPPPPPPAPLVAASLRAQPAPAAAAPIDSVPADLRRAVEEIDQYVSMGFVEDARGVLAEVGARLAAYPALVQRLAELGLQIEEPSEMDELLGEAPVAVEEEPPPADEPIQLGEDFLEFTPSSRLPSAPAPVAAPPPAAAPTLGGDGEGFDLASELGGLFGAQPAVAEAPASAASGTDLGDASLSDIFREFQKGVDKQLGKEDYETRYNLGIAYKEMGLVDEAIAEFQLAAKDENRLLECTSMLGMCFVEKGMPKLAVKWFEKGLAAPGRKDEEYKGIRYDLGDALEQAGELRQALAAFEEVFGQDASFRDVGERIERLNEKIQQSGPRH